METSVQDPASVQESPKGGFWKIQALVFEPRKAFEEINLHPTWFLPLFLCVIMGALSFTLLFQALGAEGLMEKAMQVSGVEQQIPEEQIESLGGFLQIQGYATAVIVPFLGVLIMAGIYLILFMLFGGESTFRKFFAVVAHCFFVYSLISTLLLGGVLLISDPWDLDLNSPATTNPSFLVDQKESPVLYTFAAAIDLPTFYYLYLAGLGLSLVARRTSLGTGLTVVIIPYLLLTAGKAVIAYIIN